MKYKKIYRVVFILRKINDIDHLSPLICKFYDNGHHVRLITLGVVKIDNYLTKYIFSKTGLLIETPILDGVNKFSKYLIVTFEKIKLFSRSNNFYFFLKYFEFLYFYLRRYILRREDAKNNVCDSVFDCNNTDLIITDKTNIFENSVYRNVAKYSSINNIPIIRIGHGFNTIVISDKSMDNNTILVPDLKNEVFDIYHSMIEIYRDSYDIRSNESSGIRIHEMSKEEVNTFLLGSMRYSKNWVNEYKEIQKFDTTKELEIDLNKKTILIVISPTKYLYVDKVANLLNSIAENFDLNIVYKPHTRKEAIDMRIKGMLSRDVKVTYTYKCTPGLIEVSDLVLLCGISSIGMHSIVASKPIIFTEYVCKYTTYYSRYLEKYTSISDSDTLTKIENIFNGSMCFNKNAYSDRIIKEMTNPNNSDDVIQDFYSLSCKIADGLY